jgi:glyoxylase-like metal-dependent hydrolase (beta-lactamase superfamily II)
VDAAGRLIALVLLLALAAAALAQAPAEDPVTLPSDARIYQLCETQGWWTNTFILAGPHGEAIIIDAADDIQPGPCPAGTTRDRWMYYPTGKSVRTIWAACVELGLKPKILVSTHGHMDHVSGMTYLWDRTHAAVMLGAGDVRADGHPKDHNRLVGGLPLVDRALQDGDLLTLDGMTLRIITTPGHSPGSICLFTRQNGKPLLFSGDTLLKHCIGPWRFVDGSGDGPLLVKSVREKLFTLPAETFLFPGHGAFTTIGEEIRLNRYLGTDVARDPVE